jgi:hypothetical protein
LHLLAHRHERGDLLVFHACKAGDEQEKANDGDEVAHALPMPQDAKSLAPDRKIFASPRPPVGEDARTCTRLV